MLFILMRRNLIAPIASPRRVPAAALGGVKKNRSRELALGRGDSSDPASSRGDSPRVARRFSAIRVEAGGCRPTGWPAGDPRDRRRRSSAMYRYVRGAPGLRGPFCWSLAPFSSLAGCMPRLLPLVLPYPAALPRNTETGSGGLGCPAGEP